MVNIKNNNNMRFCKACKQTYNKSYLYRHLRSYKHMKNNQLKLYMC